MGSQSFGSAQVHLLSPKVNAHYSQFVLESPDFEKAVYGSGHQCGYCWTQTLPWFLAARRISPLYRGMLVCRALPLSATLWLSSTLLRWFTGKNRSGERKSAQLISFPALSTPPPSYALTCALGPEIFHFQFPAKLATSAHDLQLSMSHNSLPGLSPYLVFSSDCWESKRLVRQAWQTVFSVLAPGQIINVCQRKIKNQMSNPGRREAKHSLTCISRTVVSKPCTIQTKLQEYAFSFSVQKIALLAMRKWKKKVFWSFQYNFWGEGWKCIFHIHFSRFLMSRHTRCLWCLCTWFLLLCVRFKEQSVSMREAHLSLISPQHSPPPHDIPLNFNFNEINTLSCSVCLFPKLWPPVPLPGLTFH